MAAKYERAAANFRALLAASGVTQAEASRRSGIPISTINNWASGVSKPVGTKVAAAARALGVATGQLLRAFDGSALDAGESISAPDFAARLSDFLERAGMSRGELASRAGFAPTKVHEWVTGRSEPPLSDVKHLAASLGVSVAELLGESAPQPRQQDAETQQLADLLERLPPEFRKPIEALIHAVAEQAGVRPR
jgi:transcriptional regulator with XRE-family HTH domain